MLSDLSSQSVIAWTQALNVHLSGLELRISSLSLLTRISREETWLPNFRVTTGNNTERESLLFHSLWVVIMDLIIPEAIQDKWDVKEGFSPGQLAQLVGALSCIPKGYSSIPGQCTWTWVAGQVPSGRVHERQPYIDVSLPLFLPPSENK